MAVKATPVVIDVYIGNTRLIVDRMACRKSGLIVGIARIGRSGIWINRFRSIQLNQVKCPDLEGGTAAVVGMTTNAAELLRSCDCQVKIITEMTFFTVAFLGPVSFMMLGSP